MTVKLTKEKECWENLVILRSDLMSKDQDESTQYITKEEVQELIDKAIDNHNKTATLISSILGGILLTFYCHGVLSLVGRV